jgi:hypothetical protein
MKKKLLVSFSGGETSAFMSQWLWRHKQDEYDMIFVFANTSQENKETLVFVERCERHFDFPVVWVEAVINPEMGKGTRSRIVDFESACRNGDVFEAFIAKHGMPNRSNPACSRELKKQTIRAYARDLGLKRKDYDVAIGIRIDEVDRMDENFKEERLLYPLITMQKMTKPKINFYWSLQPFRLNLKGYEGNCKVCYKKSLRKLLTIAKETPEKFEWTVKMEEKYENFIPESRAHNKKIKNAN